MLQVLLLTGAITVPIRLHQSTLRVADGLLAPWNQGAAPATLWDSWPYCLGRMACVGADFVTDSGVVNQQLLTLRGTNLSKFQDFSLPSEVGKRRKKPFFVDDVGPALKGRVYKCVCGCVRVGLGVCFGYASRAASNGRGTRGQRCASRG